MARRKPTLTVAELIEKLQRFPAEALVAIEPLGPENVLVDGVTSVRRGRSAFPVAFLYLDGEPPTPVVNLASYTRPFKRRGRGEGGR